MNKAELRKKTGKILILYSQWLNSGGHNVGDNYLTFEDALDEIMSLITKAEPEQGEKG